MENLTYLFPGGFIGFALQQEVPKAPGRDENSPDAVLLNDSPHGDDTLPLLGVGCVVIAGHGLAEAEHTGDGPRVAQIGHEDLAVFNHNNGGG